MRFRSNSKDSPAINSQSRRRVDIASRSGGIFGIGDACCDRKPFRAVDFFLEVEFFREGELLWEGEPSCEPFSMNLL